MADKAPIKIVGDQLVMGPVTVGFQRTLRIPETGLHYLPPGLGRGRRAGHRDRGHAAG